MDKVLQSYEVLRHGPIDEMQNLHLPEIRELREFVIGETCRANAQADEVLEVAQLIRSLRTKDSRLEPERHRHLRQIGANAPIDEDRQHRFSTVPLLREQHM